MAPEGANNYVPRWDGLKLVTGSIYNDPNNGNVGIGTPGPRGKLELSRSTLSDIILSDKNWWGGVDFPRGRIYSAVDGGLWSDSRLTLQSMSGSGGSYNFIDTISLKNGNVGIGTPSPSARLDVNGDSIFRGPLRFSESYGGGWFMQDSSWIRTYNSKSVWADSGLLGSQGGLTVGYGGYGPPGGGAIIAGNVGIGTASPGNKLDVRGITQIADDGVSPDTSFYASFGVTRAKVAQNNAYIGLSKAETFPWVCWTAYAILTVEQGFHRIYGYHDLPVLLRTLGWTAENMAGATGTVTPDQNRGDGTPQKDH